MMLKKVPEQTLCSRHREQSREEREDGGFQEGPWQEKNGMEGSNCCLHSN